MQAMFDTVFAFHGTRQFFPDMPYNAGDRFLPAGYQAGGYLWSTLPDDPSTGSSESFGVYLVYKQDTFRLAEIEIDSSIPRFNATLSPQRVIRELGEPSQAFISVRGTERGDILGLSLALIRLPVQRSVHPH
jgi:hypothetical protein